MATIDLRKLSIISLSSIAMAYRVGTNTAINAAKRAGVKPTKLANGKLNKLTYDEAVLVAEEMEKATTIPEETKNNSVAKVKSKARS